jgi:hypothetical protein
MNVTDDFKFTIEEVAGLLNRTPQTITKLIKTNKLSAEKRRVPRDDAFKFNTKFFISEKSVEKYFDSLSPLTLKVDMKKARTLVQNKTPKVEVKYLDKIKKVHNLVNEFGGIESFKKTFKLYCVYRELFEK